MSPRVNQCVSTSLAALGERRELWRVRGVRDDERGQTPSVTPAAVTSSVCLYQSQTKIRSVGDTTAANADACLPMNHIQLRQSGKHVHSAITSDQGDDTKRRSPEEITLQLSRINILMTKP